MGQSVSLRKYEKKQNYFRKPLGKAIEGGIPTFEPKKNRANIIFSSINALPYNCPDIVTLLMSGNEVRGNMGQFTAALMTYTNLQILDMSHCGITEFPAEFFLLPKLKSFICVGNKITEIDFSKSKSIETLDLTDNRIKSFPKCNDFIRDLSLDYNELTVVKVESELLTRLSLSGNSITNISGESYLPHLNYIDLSKNRLSRSPDFASFAPKLITLNMCYNSISNMDKIPKTIQVLKLSFNQISVIPDDIIDYTSLRFFLISNNCITHVPKLPFSIQTLNLMHNCIKTFEDSETPDLVHFMISRNKLVKLPQLARNQITEVSFFANSLHSLSTSLFSDRIGRLDLSNNKLDSIPSDLFAFPNLYSLNLSRNNITQLPPMYSSTLIFLNVSENPLDELPEAFPQPLETLFIHGCGLKILDLSITKAPELIHIDASNNALKEFPYIPSLLHVNLSQNNFCRFPIFPPTMLSIDIACNEITELHDDFIYTNLLSLNISYNNIKVFPKKVRLPSLERLSMAFNPYEEILFVDNIPSILVLDTVGYDVKLSHQIQITHRLTSNANDYVSDETINYIDPGKRASFAQHQGKFSYSDDFLFIRDKQKSYGFLYLDDPVLTQNFLYELYGWYQSLKSIDTRTIKTCLDEMISANNFIPTIGFIVELNEEFIAARIGNVTIQILNEEGLICFSIGGSFPPPLLPHTNYFVECTTPLNKQECQKYLQIGEAIDRKEEYDILSICKSGIEKWAIIATDTVFHFNRPSKVADIVKRANSAADIAYELRNKTIETRHDGNITVIVIKLQ